jgi:hypothetical protein
MNRALRVVALVAALAGCDGPDTFVLTQFGGPAGVIEGTVTYLGPAPCTQGGRIVGAAVLLGFDTRLLPPPDGLGTLPGGLDVIPGETLFQAIRGQLPFSADGSLACPDEDAIVTAGASFSLSPLAGGVYQVRAFYDRDGDFDPGFTIFNLPTRGDVAGGALADPAAAAAGAPPRFVEIALGVPDGDGAWSIPDEGARVGGISVALGLPLPLERPLFHVAVAATPSGDLDPLAPTMPADFELATFDPADPAATEASFLAMTLAAGVPTSEKTAAGQPPFGFAGGDASFLLSRQDVDRDGDIDADDHVPDSAQLPSLFPLALFARLDDASPPAVALQPATVILGLTLRGSLVETALAPPDLAEVAPEVRVAVRPAAICVDPTSTAPATIVISRETDGAGNPIVTDEAALRDALGAQLGRPVEIAYGCLPQGRYSMNLVYGTGQAWSIPNEAGVCSPLEPPSSDGAICGTRPRLPSQGVVLTIGAPAEPAYCLDHPTPPACLSP